MGGYVFGRLGRAPAVGDEVVTPGGRVLRVAALDGLRVARVQLLPSPAAPGAGPLAAGLLALVVAWAWVKVAAPALLVG